MTIVQQTGFGGPREGTARYMPYQLEGVVNSRNPAANHALQNCLAAAERAVAAEGHDLVVVAFSSHCGLAGEAVASVTVFLPATGEHVFRWAKQELTVDGMAAKTHWLGCNE